MSDSDESLFTIPSASVDTVWPSIEPLLSAFEASMGTASAEEIRTQAREGYAQIWGVATPQGVKGVCVTRIHETPRNRFCSIWVAYGNDVFGDLMTVYQAIEDWASELGCTAVQINGRRGWQRVLPGFKETAVVLEKSLIGVKH